MCYFWVDFVFDQSPLCFVWSWLYFFYKILPYVVWWCYSYCECGVGVGGLSVVVFDSKRVCASGYAVSCQRVSLCTCLREWCERFVRESERARGRELHSFYLSNLSRWGLRWHFVVVLVKKVTHCADQRTAFLCRNSGLFNSQTTFDHWFEHSKRRS